MKDPNADMNFCPRCGSRLRLAEVFDRVRPVCDQCGYIVFVNPKLVAGVVPLWDGQVVLIRRRIEPGFGKWSFPTGYVNFGEEVSATAVREAEEETGLKVEIQGLLNVYSEPGEPTVLVVYAGKVVGGDVRPGSEVFEVGIFEPGNWPDLAFDHDRAILDECIARCVAGQPQP
jgi:8-oxo-dGTP diphosphatase